MNMHIFFASMHGLWMHAVKCLIFNALSVHNRHFLLPFYLGRTRGWREGERGVAMS